MQHPNFDDLSIEARGEIMAGALAYHALKTEHHDYRHWVKVGKAIVQLRRAAAEQAGVDTNSLKHPAYRAAYKQLISAEPAGDLREIDSGTSTHAAWLANNLANVEAWRSTLTQAQRISLNHPTAIWRKHPDGRKAEKEEEPARPKRPGQASEIDAATQRLNDTFDRVEERLGPDLAGLFDLSPERIEDSARNFIDIFGEDKAQDFLIHLLIRLHPEHEEAIIDAIANIIDGPETEDEDDAPDETPEPVKRKILDTLSAVSGRRRWFDGAWFQRHDISEDDVLSMIRDGYLKRNPRDQYSFGLV
jgi:hypothetical protein